jgi:hypothetical protein
MHQFRLADPPSLAHGPERRCPPLGPRRYNPPSLKWPGSVPARAHRAGIGLVQPHLYVARDQRRPITEAPRACNE